MSLLSCVHDSVRGLGSAVKTLTSIPWPWRGSKELASSLPWFPVVGLFIGLVLYVLGIVWDLSPFDEWSGGAALLMVGAELWLTRGLHLDGLADWADSIGVFDQERKLAVMKDVPVGAFGVMALVLAFMAKWVAFERLYASDAMVWVLLVSVFSRGMLVELITTMPYARSGDGTARAFVKKASQRHRLTAHLICFALCLFFGPLGLALFGLAQIATLVLKKRFSRTFGGITGDLLGTAHEITGIGLLLLCAFPGKKILFYTGWGWAL